MNIWAAKYDNMKIAFKEKVIIVILCLIFIFPFDIVSAKHNQAIAETVSEQADSISEIEIRQPLPPTGQPDTDAQTIATPDSLPAIDGPDMTILESTDSVAIDSVTNVVTFDDMPAGFSERKTFNPDPSRAIWLSALLPGLGQIYNRRYWKIPIVIGGFMGLGYATSWNNNQLQDYTQAYRDLTDSDPATNSYMNFFPPNTSESDFDKNWLEATMKSRKDYYRRNRDLCIICLVGLYLLCMVDAYVDASLAHFDISDDLSLDLQPAMFIAPADNKVALGLNWALNF